MNFGKSRSRRQSGNAMIYILLALGLLALLTASLMSQDSTGGDDISKDQVEFQATQILSYAAAAQNVIDQMVGTGADPGAIDFAFPNATSFETAPYKNKLFHPQGGGLNYKTADPKIFTGIATPVAGWYAGRFNNIEWTPSTAQDIVITAFQISKPICEAINKRINGSTTIPALSSGSLQAYLVSSIHGGVANTNFMASACPACNGAPALCISNLATDAWAYYSIILGQ